ncbi:MAG: hypothetical protein J6I61_07525 [Prevotella sp.]|nr:hypothetical protein [Prevotella sp.]
MDPLSRELQTFLVRMGYEGIDHTTEHMMEHLVALLNPDEEEALVHYYGLFGEERKALDDIAKDRNEEPETTLAAIDKSIRKIAVTPEWQMIKTKLNENK